MSDSPVGMLVSGSTHMPPIVSHWPAATRALIFFEQGRVVFRDLGVVVRRGLVEAVVVRAVHQRSAVWKVRRIFRRVSS